MKSILALSKRLFDKHMSERGIADKTVSLVPDLYLISVCGEESLNDKNDDPTLAPHFERDHPNVLNLVFDDVVSGFDVSESGLLLPSKDGKAVILFNEAMAAKVRDFVDGIKNTNEATLLVHCALGVSRSGAIAEHCAKRLGYDMTRFYEDNRSIEPNLLVRRLLSQTI